MANPPSGSRPIRPVAAQHFWRSSMIAAPYRICLCWNDPSRPRASSRAKLSVTSGIKIATSALPASCPLSWSRSPGRLPSLRRQSDRLPRLFLETQMHRIGSRLVTHTEHEDVRELVRGGDADPLFKRSMRLRRGVERVFADARASGAWLAYTFAACVVPRRRSCWALRSPTWCCSPALPISLPDRNARSRPRPAADQPGPVRAVLLRDDFLTWVRDGLDQAGSRLLVGQWR